VVLVFILVQITRRNSRHESRAFIKDGQKKFPLYQIPAGITTSVLFGNTKNIPKVSPVLVYVYYVVYNNLGGT